MPNPPRDLDPAIRDQIDRYILFSNNDQDNIRRGELMRPHVKSCGKNFQLAPGATIPWPGSLIVGDDVYLGLWTYIGGGNITLQDKVMIGPHCSITGGNHAFNLETDDYSAPHHRDAITIGHGTWLAAGASVTTGVTIGRANLIAAGAVVTKSTEDYAIMAGVPAKQIGSVK